MSNSKQREPQCLPIGRPRNEEYENMAATLAEWWEEGGEGRVVAGPYHNRKAMTRTRVCFWASVSFKELPLGLHEVICSRAAKDDDGKWWLFFSRKGAIHE